MASSLSFKSVPTTGVVTRRARAPQQSRQAVVCQAERTNGAQAAAAAAAAAVLMASPASQANEVYRNSVADVAGIGGAVSKTVDSVKSATSDATASFKAAVDEAPTTVQGAAKEVAREKPVGLDLKAQARANYRKAIERNAGSRVSESVGRLAENPKGPVRDAQRGLKGAARNVKESTKDALGNVSNKPVGFNLKNKAQSNLDDATSGASENIGKLAENTKDAARDAKRNLKGAARDVQQGAKDTFGNISTKPVSFDLKTKAQRNLDKVSGGASENVGKLAENTKDAARDAKRNLKGAARDVQQGAKDTFGNISTKPVSFDLGNNASSAKSAVEDNASKAKDAVQRNAQGASENIGKIAESAKDNASGASGGIKGAIKDAVDSAKDTFRGVDTSNIDTKPVSVDIQSAAQGNDLVAFGSLKNAKNAAQDAANKGVDAVKRSADKVSENIGKVAESTEVAGNRAADKASGVDVQKVRDQAGDAVNMAKEDLAQGPGLFNNDNVRTNPGIDTKPVSFDIQSAVQGDNLVAFGNLKQGYRDAKNAAQNAADSTIDTVKNNADRASENIGKMAEATELAGARVVSEPNSQDIQKVRDQASDVVQMAKEDLAQGPPLFGPGRAGNQ